ncbi:nuclear factor 7, brain-like [Xiphias gladius]|uniref:nuclear factor 7, brain-like n=1 Tax=Xiphias gladius TaxID=8245 RepID=UPI001A99CE97|nr:nuclear factor 7, brain-like [Xiphias gladius]
MLQTTGEVGNHFSFAHVDTWLPTLLMLGGSRTKEEILQNRLTVKCTFIGPIPLTQSPVIRVVTEKGVAELCPEHEEKLKLFCVTDQQIACIICRDGEKHEGHKFKPIKAAAASVKKELEMGMENLSDDICATESLANTQREEISESNSLSGRRCFSPQYRQHSIYSQHSMGSMPQYYETTYSEVTSERYASACSTNEFTSGQHYWEIEVGKREYWKVGVKNNYLSYNKQKYVTSSQDTELTFTGRPQKIGIYLDCLSEELSFYDAENMSHIHTMGKCLVSEPVAAYFEYKFSKAADHNPLRVCWF